MEMKIPSGAGTTQVDVHGNNSEEEGRPKYV